MERKPECFCARKCEGREKQEGSQEIRDRRAQGNGQVYILELVKITPVCYKVRSGNHCAGIMS